MHPFIKRVPVLAAMAVVVVMIGWQVDAEPTRTTMPDIKSLVHYTTVKRGNVTEHIMTSSEAVAAVKAGQPVPDGTHFVLVDYRDGKLYRYFVMEKGRGWGDDYGQDRRTGDWQFQWFQPDGGINMAENTARCQSCHSSSADNDYLFTFDRLRSFDGSATE